MQRQLARPLLQQAQLWGWQSLRALSGTPAASQGVPYDQLSIGELTQCSAARAHTHTHTHTHTRTHTHTHTHTALHCSTDAVTDRCSTTQACPRSRWRASVAWP